MKRKYFVVITCAMLTALLMGNYAIAKKYADWEHYAYGTLDSYDQVDASAEVVSGFWNLKVIGKQVWFNGYYLEKNLDTREDEPVGSTDIFEWEMVGNPDMSWNGDILTIEGTINTKKTAAMPDGTYQTTSGSLVQTLIFDFGEGEFLRDVFPPDPEDPDIWGDPPSWWQDWDLRGTILDYYWPT